MNYFTYRFKLLKLNCKKIYFERSISKDIAEARGNGNNEKMENLHSLLNDNNINYNKTRDRLQTKYFSLLY